MGHKVSLVGVTGFRNRGVEALVGPLTQNLLASQPDGRVDVFTWTPEFDSRRIQDPRVGFHKVGNFHPSFTRLERVTRRLGVPRSGRIEGWQALLESNLVVFSGGDCLSREYGDASFRDHLTPLRLAAAARIPFVLYGQSIGPFGTANQRQWWDDVSSKAAHISVREAKTYRHLAEDLGVPTERLSLTADPAFLLEQSASGIALGNRLRAADRPLVGVALSQGIASWTGVDSGTRLAIWETILRRLQQELGAGIVLVPHVQETHTDDSIICQELWKRLDFNPHITVLAGDFSAPDYKGVLSRCDMVVAERMHAGIAALSSWVPTALVAYSVKARGILEDLVGPDHAYGKALIEGTEFQSPNVVWAQLKRLWNDREHIGSVLKESVPKAKELALDGLSRLQEFIA